MNDADDAVQDCAHPDLGQIKCAAADKALFGYVFPSICFVLNLRFELVQIKQDFIVQGH